MRCVLSLTAPVFVVQIVITGGAVPPADGGTAMAKFTIPHTCGHESEVNLLGKMADRDRKAAWLASRPCRECALADARAAGPTVRVGRAGAGYRIACTEDTYAHKDALKAAGYRFVPEPAWQVAGTAAEVVDAASDALAMGWTVLTAAGTPVTADGLDAMRAKFAPAAA